MKRLRRDQVHAAGVIAGGALLLLGILAVLTEGGDPAQASWSPDLALLQPGALTAPESLAPDRERSAASGRRADPAAAAAEGAALSPELAGAVADVEAQVRELRRREASGEDDEDPGEPGWVVGQVVDPAGQPVADAVVKLHAGRRDPRAFEATTDALGRFRLELAARRYRQVWAAAEGWTDSEQTSVGVPAGGEVEVVLAVRTACRLTGLVLDGQGAPVVGAEIRAEGQDLRASTRTDDQGRFAVPDLAEGLYRVEVEAPGFVETRRDDVPVSAAHGGELQLALDRAGRLEGRVSRADGPLAEPARVFVYRGDRRLDAVRTDDQGRYVVEGLDPGPVEVFARSESFSHTCRVNAAIEPGARAVLDLRLDEGARVVGVVRDPSGAALVGVQVQAHSVEGDVRREAQTDAEGRYVLEHLYPGAFRVFVPQGGGGRELEPRVEERVQVTSGEHPLDLVLPVGAVYAGVIVDPSGAPVPDAWVFAIVGEEYRGRVRSDDEGRFRLEGLQADDYRLFVRVAEDRLVAMSPLRLGADQVLTEQRVLVRPPARLRGRVVDAAGLPLPGLELRLRALENPVRRRATSDADGGFELGPLYDGAYELALDEGSLALLARQRGVAAARVAPVRLAIGDQQDARVDLVVELQAE